MSKILKRIKSVIALLGEFWMFMLMKVSEKTVSDRK